MRGLYMNQIQNPRNNIQEPDIMNNIKSGIGNIGDSIQSSGADLSSKFDEFGSDVRSVSDTTKSTLGTGLDAIKSVLPPAPVPSNGISFSLSDYTSMSTEFLESNSYIARAAFILLVVFTFFVLLRLATGLIKYFIGRSEDPVKVVDGLSDGIQAQIITQGFGGKTIFRSSNEESGIEFTWCVSLYVKDAPISPKYSHIFNKGSIPSFIGGDAVRSDIQTINQAPGMYLNNSTNSLVVTMDTFNQTNTTRITIPNIPHNKWLNVLIRCKGKLVDIYINGQVVQSVNLSDIPKQNYGNVYVSQSGGFVGSISNLWYFNHALSINEIQNILKDSVNLQLSTTTGGINLTNTDYLGFKWFVQ
jgi:hypothetical protein